MSEMDFNERVIPGVSSNFMFKEALARYEFASKYVKKDFKILDLGSGTGYGAKVLSGSKTQYLGIDINTEAVAFSNKHYGSTNIKFKKDNILNKLPKATYDVLVSFEVIEHLKNPELFLTNIKSTLKKDGIFILSTPNAPVNSPGGGVGSPYHVKEYNFEELSKLLNKQFRKVKIFGQFKSKKALNSWRDFLKSQNTRENISKSDFLLFRKIIPKQIKEIIWKYLGNFFGRRTQENLNTKDFPIKSKSVKLCSYFVVVCQK